MAAGALRNYRLVLSRVPGVGGSRTFRVWEFAAAVQQVSRFDWDVSDFNALIGEFTAGAQVDVAVFDTTYRRDRADGYVDDWTAPKVETAAVGDGVLVGRARSVGAIDELADWTRAVDSREWTAQVDTCPVERVFGGLLAAPEQRRAEDGRRHVSLRLRSFAAQLEDVRAGGLELADGLFLAALPVSGAAGVLQRLWQDWLAARPVEVAQGGTVTQQPLSVTPDRVAPAVGALTFGPAVVEHLSFAGILDRIAEEHNLSWAVDDYGALTMTRSRDVRAAAVLDEAGGVERAPRLVWDRRHLRTRQTVLGAPVEGRIVETFTGTAHTVTITEPRLTLRQGTGAADSRDDGRRLDGARRVFAAHPYVVKVTGVEVRRGPSGSPVRQFGEGYTGSRRWFWDPGATHRLTQAAGEPVLQAADTLTIRGVTSREPKESSTSRTAGVYGIIEAVERDPSLRADLVAPRSRVLLEANDRIALRGDVRLRLGTHRGLREGMGVRIAGVPGVDERMVFLIAGVGQEIVPGADAAPAQIRTTLALQADDVPVAGAAPQETFAGRYRRLPPVEAEAEEQAADTPDEEQTADAPAAVRWPALTAGSFVRVNPAGTALEMRTPAQVLADLLPTVTAGSFVRVNPGGTLEPRTSAQVLADLLPAVTAGSFLRVNPGGTLEVRTSAQVLADLLPALTAGSFLRVNSAGTGLEVRTSAQVLADLLPALTAESYLRVNSAGTGLEVRTSAEVLADLLPALTAESFLRVNSAGTGLEVRTSAEVLADLLPALTAESFLRVNSAGTGLEMRTLAQIRADLLPTVTTTSILVVNSGGTLGVRALSGLLPALTAGSYLRVNSAGTGLEMRTLAQVLADLLPTVTTTSYLRVNRGGTLGVLTSAQALRDLLPTLTAGSYLRVNSGRTGLEMRTLAQVLADLLPTVTTTSILVVNSGGTLGVRSLSGLLPRLTAGSFLRVNSGGTGLVMRTLAQLRADLLPLTTAGSYLRVNRGRTGLEPRTLAQLLADLLPTVTTTSILVVNRGGTLGVRTSAQVRRDLLPTVTTTSYLRVNRGGTLGALTSAQVLRDLLPTVTTTSILVVNRGGTLGVRALSGLLPRLTAGSFLRVNSGGTGLVMRTPVQVLTDLLAAGAPRRIPRTGSGTVTAPPYACRWLVACWGAGGGGGASDGSRQAGTGGATSVTGSGINLVGKGGAGGYAGEVNRVGATPGGGSGGAVIPGAGAPGGAGGRRFTESHGSTHSRHGHDGGAGGLAVELFKPWASTRYTLTVGAGGAGGRGGGQGGSAGSPGAIAIIELR